MNTSLEEQVKQALKLAQRAADYMEIQNVMGKHMYYHGVGAHEQEMEELWAKKHEITWSGNFGVQVGWKSIYKNYVEDHRKSRQIALEAVIKKHPEIENKPENWGIGTFIAHTLTTPVIEIAEDGQTAKGIWYSPGIVTEIGPDGEPMPMHMWEKYGVDFVKEDGQWKIWHIHMYYDLNWSPTGSWTDPPKPPPASTEAKSEAPKRTYDKPPTVVYKGYSPTTVPVLLPEIPKPYKTFSEVEPY